MGIENILWDQRGIPQKGWTCEGVTDLGSPDGQCETCRREEIRYVHHMAQDNYDGGPMSVASAPRRWKTTTSIHVAGNRT